MVGLGDRPGGTFNSTAYGVSGDGTVVVGFGDSDSGYGAFRWTSGSGMERLWDELLAGGVNPKADGWTRLTVATGISPDGSAIVGYGVRNGNNEAFVAIIP